MIPRIAIHTAQVLCSVALLLAGCEYGSISPSSLDGGGGKHDAADDAGQRDAEQRSDSGVNDTGHDAGNDASKTGNDSSVIDDDDSGVSEAADPVVQLGSGLMHSCARFASGGVKCWGYSDRGQLGYGDTSNRGDGPNEMGEKLPYVSLGKDRKAMFLAVGRKVTCVLLDDNHVKCWGYNEIGQLGLGTWCTQDCTTAPVLDNRGDEAGEMGDALPAVSLPAGQVTQLAVGGEIACVVLDDTSLYCWGRNWSGALGNSGGCSNTCDVDIRGDEPGEMGSAIPAIDVGTGLTVKRMSLGWDYVVVLLSDGSVKAWGRNNEGELGVGDDLNRGDDPNEMGDNLKPVILPPGRKATQVYAGPLHACARLDDGTLRCWGSNGYGELGVGDTDPRCMSEGYVACTALAEVAAEDSPRSVALGNDHSCVIRPQGDLRCFGMNDQGQLGVGDTITRGDTVSELAGQAASEPLSGGHRYVAVTAGHSFSCALTDDARVRCWGVNDGGQLGLGDPRARGTLPPSTDGPIELDL